MLVKGLYKNGTLHTEMGKFSVERIIDTESLQGVFEIKEIVTKQEVEEVLIDGEMVSVVVSKVFAELGEIYERFDWYKSMVVKTLYEDEK